jgi:hypothetical protein
LTQLTDRQPMVAYAPEAAPRDTSRDGMLAAYVATALVLLLPGLLGATRTGLDNELVGPALRWLDGHMQAIGHWRAPRLWLGIAGLTMMASLLVFYPLRKAFGIGASLSVATWFHIHVVLGLLGPVFIAYHC